MDLEYDHDKDEENRRSRGLPFDLGAVVLANRVAEFEDDRRDYGERRLIAYGTIGGELHVCVYTMRGTTYRIISLRRAKKEERQKWQPKP